MTRKIDEVVVSCDERSAVWRRDVATGEVLFSGDEDMVRYAKLAVAGAEDVAMFRDVLVEAADDDPLCAAAALFAWNPARSVIVSAPDTLWSTLDSLRGDQPSEDPETLFA